MGCEGGAGREVQRKGDVRARTDSGFFSLTTNSSGVPAPELCLVNSSKIPREKFALVRTQLLQKGMFGGKGSLNLPISPSPLLAYSHPQSLPNQKETGQLGGEKGKNLFPEKTKCQLMWRGCEE